MKQEVYEGRQITEDRNVFNFYSEGINGTILKRVIIRETEFENVYHLAFGCIDEKNEIDDTSVSIMATATKY